MTRAILLTPAGDIGEGRLGSRVHDDPHRVALEDRDLDHKVTKSTWAAFFFWEFFIQSSLSFAILCVLISDGFCH